MRRLVLACALVGCRPEVGERPSLVDSPRILAVRAEPAEAAPGQEVSYTALIAGTDALVSFATCLVPKPLGDPSIVSSACLRDVVPSLEIPSDACARFGPEPPPGGYRPRDPDGTGGYYVPIRATLLGDTAFHLERVTCSLGDAAVDLARTFAREYQPNHNPQKPSVDVRWTAGRATITVGWRAEDVESYLWLDREAQRLVTRRESMRVSFFADDGAFDADHRGRDEDDPATTVENGWEPGTRGRAHLWIVLRDARGGVAWRDLVVSPTP